jgi:hypothetical protein
MTISLFTTAAVLLMDGAMQYRQIRREKSTHSAALLTMS